MSCILNSGYQLQQCSRGMAGIVRLYIVPFSASTSTGAVTNVDNVITGFTGSSSAVTFYAFDCVNATAEASETAKGNIQNGTSFWDQEITFVINKPNYTLRNQIATLATTTCHVIALNRNGDYKLFGKTGGCDALEIKSGSGKKADDPFQYQIKFTAQEPVESHFLSSGTIFTSSY